MYRRLKGWHRLIVEYRREPFITESARIKEKIVNFFEEFGLEATIKAFGRKKSSIYNYREKLTEIYGNLEDENYPELSLLYFAHLVFRYEIFGDDDGVGITDNFEDVILYKFRPR